MTFSRAFAMACWGLAVFAAVGTIVVRLVSQAPFLPAAFGFDPGSMVAFIAMGLSWTSIGAILVARRPENLVGRLVILSGMGYALAMFFVALTFAFAVDRTANGLRLAGLTGWATVLCTQSGALAFVIGFIFPTGRPQSPRWAWVVRLLWLMIFIFSAIVLLQPGTLHLFPTLQNPFGIGPDLRGGRAISPVITLFGWIIAPLLVISLATRYRSADRTERQQLKWLALALVASGVGLGLAIAGAESADRKPDGLGLTLYALAATAVPVAIGIAILRYHLYDIDRLISRSLSYGVVTGVLAAVFSATAIALSAVLGSFAQGQSLAVAASTLLVIALFGPLRRRAQAAVDRRFDRARYDAAVTVQALTGRLRDDVDIDRVQSDVLRVLDQTFHPTTAAVWLRGGSR